MSDATAPIVLAWAFFLCVFGAALIYITRGEAENARWRRERLGRILVEILSPVAALCSLVLFCRPSKPILFHSEMGQNFWMAIVAWTTCFLVTIIVSLATKRQKTDEELRGLVYALTPRPETAHEPWYKQPVTVGVLVLAATIVLNILFW